MKEQGEHKDMTQLHNHFVVYADRSEKQDLRDFQDICAEHPALQQAKNSQGDSVYRLRYATGAWYPTPKEALRNKGFYPGRKLMGRNVLGKRGNDVQIIAYHDYIVTTVASPDTKGALYARCTSPYHATEFVADISNIDPAPYAESDEYADMSLENSMYDHRIFEDGCPSGSMSLDDKEFYATCPDDPRLQQIKTSGLGWADYEVYRRKDGTGIWYRTHEEAMQDKAPCPGMVDKGVSVIYAYEYVIHGLDLASQSIVWACWDHDKISAWSANREGAEVLACKSGQRRYHMCNIHGSGGPADNLRIIDKRGRFVAAEIERSKGRRVYQIDPGILGSGQWHSKIETMGTMRAETAKLVDEFYGLFPELATK